jgi:hypothetical protein
MLVAMTQDDVARDQVTSDKNDDWKWLKDNSTAFIAILSVAVVAIRLLAVARGDPQTAYAILQIGGTGSVLIATLVSALGLLAIPVCATFGFYAWRTVKNTVPGSSALSTRVILLITGATVMFLIALYMSPVLLLLYSIVFLGIQMLITVRASDGMAKRLILISVVVYILGIIAYEGLSPTPWLPVQTITVAGQNPFSGYVLSQANGQTSILTSNPEGIITLPSQSITNTEQCTSHLYLLNQATLFDVLENLGHNLMTYKPCPSTRYSQVSPARDP